MTQHMKKQGLFWKYSLLAGLLAGLLVGSFGWFFGQFICGLGGGPCFGTTTKWGWHLLGGVPSKPYVATGVITWTLTVSGAWSVSFA